MTVDEKRPPIPMSLAGRPVQGGIAVPWVNASLADGGADFRSTHRTKFEMAWRQGRCQSCGSMLVARCVLVCGPRQILTRRFDEPPVCPPCALYASQACPMVAGRVEVYPDRPRLTEGHRGEACPEGCGCSGWTEIDEAHSADMGGQPALPWYACWVVPHCWQLTGHQGTYQCSDLGCEHERLFIDGAVLLMDPLKIVLVSEPGNGRVWRTLTADEATAHARASLEAAGVTL